MDSTILSVVCSLYACSKQALGEPSPVSNVRLDLIVPPEKQDGGWKGKDGAQKGRGKQTLLLQPSVYSLFHFVVAQKWSSVHWGTVYGGAQLRTAWALWGLLHTTSWDCLFCKPMAFSISELHHNGNSDFAILIHTLQHQWYRQEVGKGNLSSSYTE